MWVGFVMKGSEPFWFTQTLGRLQPLATRDLTEEKEKSEFTDFKQNRDISIYCLCISEINICKQKFVKQIKGDFPWLDLTSPVHLFFLQNLESLTCH